MLEIQCPKAHVKQIRRCLVVHFNHETGVVVYNDGGKWMLRYLSTTALISGVGLISIPASVTAQEDQEFQIEEVVVTAERRSRSIQDVPIAITALRGDTLENLQITSTEDLSQYTPGLHIFAEAVGSEVYTIRGIGRTNEDLSSDSGVAVFMDDIYIARQSAANLAFFDVERVEVLRGPQGTLYGKNASGGAINILTRKPTDEVSGWAALDYGNYDRLNIEGAVNGPLVKDKLFARLAFVSRNRDGIYTNLTTGEKGNNIDTEGVRGSLRYLASDDLEIIATVDWNNAEQEGVLKSVIVDVPGTPYILKDFFTVDTFPTQEDNIRSSRAGTNGEQGIETYGGSLRVNNAFDNFDFSSITGYREESSFQLEDNDRAAERSAEVSSEQSTWTFSQEFRFVSTGEGPLTWAGGAFWFHEEGTRAQRRFSDFFGPGGLQGPGSPEVQQSITTHDTAIDTDALAVYGQASYAVNDILSVTGGLRYTWEEKAFSVDASAVPITPGGDPYSLFIPNGDFTTDVAESWDRLTPHVGLEARFSDDLLAYASYSHGFKSGGFDGQPGGPNLEPFRHERVINYEAGLKASFLKNRLQTNLSVFYAEFKDLQQQGFSSTGLPITTNAADARVQGIELEIEARPTENFSISGGLSLLDTEYKDFFIEVFDPTIQGGPPFRLVDKAGERIGIIPKYSFNVRAQYSHPLDSGARLNFGADLAGVSNTITVFNTLWSDAYEVFNARIMWVSPDETWEAGVWVNNITDEEYYRGGGPVPDLFDTIARLGLVADPRTYGVTVRFRFGG